jgi:hypothetical protein
MRPFVLVAILALLVVPGPVAAQLEGLLREAERLQLDRDRPVTLDLRRVTAREAVAKLAELSEVELSCADALAERKVTLICHERSAREVGEGLARAVQGRWRKEGRAFILEPADLLQLLTPAEVVAETNRVFTRPGSADALAAGQLGRQVLSSLAPPQLQAAQSPQGLQVSQLSPPQQQLIAGMLGTNITRALDYISYSLQRAVALETATVSIEVNGGQETLRVKLRDGGISFALQGR